MIINLVFGLPDECIKAFQRECVDNVTYNNRECIKDNIGPVV